jgi:hypothetical protein
MTPEARAEAARRAVLERYTQLQRSQREQIIASLRLAQQEINAVLAGVPTDWQTHRLTAVLQSVEASLARFAARQSGAWVDGVNSAWGLGTQLVDAPYLAIGVKHDFGAIDDRLLLSMRTFLVNKIGDISAAQRAAITGQLQLAAIGGITRQQAIAGIATQLDGDRARAIMITRTELGRAQSAATWLRLKQAAERDPEIRKQWRRSGKRNSRHTHDFADGQLRKVTEFFQIGGEPLMYPRDPTASAKNTINCGCTILPARANWRVQTPGARPFSNEEIAAQPARATIQQVLQERAIRAEADMRAASGLVPLPPNWTAQLVANDLSQLTFDRAVKAGLTQENAALIAHWTLRGQQINQALLANDLVEGVPAEQFSLMLRGAIAQLPRAEQPLTRWQLGRPLDTFLDQFVVDGIWETPRFLSASLPGGEFLRPDARPAITWLITPARRSSGGVIGSISYKPAEAEVLFPPGTQFAVEGVDRRKGRYTITLREL